MPRYSGFLQSLGLVQLLQEIQRAREIIADLGPVDPERSRQHIKESNHSLNISHLGSWFASSADLFSFLVFF